MFLTYANVNRAPSKSLLPILCSPYLLIQLGQWFSIELEAIIKTLAERHPEILGGLRMAELKLHTACEDSYWTLVATIICAALRYHQDALQPSQFPMEDSLIVFYDAEWHEIHKHPIEVGISYLRLRDVVGIPVVLWKDHIRVRFIP